MKRNNRSSMKFQRYCALIYRLYIPATKSDDESGNH